MNNEKIIILKLGGSLITDKSSQFSVREDIIKKASKQILDYINKKKKIIIVHGGGSFGHPLAKKFDLINGFNNKINQQLLGLVKTHSAMLELNSIILNEFHSIEIPAISFHASSIYTFDENNRIKGSNIGQIEIALNLGLIPILYGDICFKSSKSFSIISGDQIIYDLCKKLIGYEIYKVIFATEQDGIFIKNPLDNKIKLAKKIKIDEIDDLKLAKLETKTDVTGGIIGKLKFIKKIAKLGISVQIINGLKNNNIYNALIDRPIICTEIIPPLKEEIFKRKIDHIKIPLKYNVQYPVNYLKFITFIHYAIPEIELKDVDIKTTFFGKKIDAPICIAAMTGGPKLAKKINGILAQAAQEENIILGIGSQRIYLKESAVSDSFKIVREFAPSIPIIGNIGIGQICEDNFNIDDFKKCIDLIDADVMAIHFNALHELIQKDRNISYKNFVKNFEIIRKEIDIPIIAKEVGCGFDTTIAKKLIDLGFDGFDVGGAGGTNFAIIESLRIKSNKMEKGRNLGEIFNNWGIPTPISIKMVRKVCAKPIIATGGLRTGMDIAKCIVLGADIGGLAYPFLKSSWNDFKNNSIQNTINEIQNLKRELKSTMWLINAKDINDLKNNEERIIIQDPLLNWFKNI
ncbi:MAG: type 2 isopentenyl-diphosphate Delta-isomerase [Promethearchaeota archaeon]